MTGIQTNSAIRYLRGAPDRDIRFECQIADLIERQTAQIERMRAALTEARPLIAGYEKTLAAMAAAAGNPMPREEAMAFDRLRTALRMIDEAMGDNDER